MCEQRSTDIIVRHRPDLFIRVLLSESWEALPFPARPVDSMLILDQPAVPVAVHPRLVPVGAPARKTLTLVYGR